MREQDNYYDDQGRLHWADLVLGEKKDYAINWANKLLVEGDTFESATWDVPTGLTEVDSRDSEGKTIIWLSASATGTYLVKCNVTTTDSGSEQIYIREIYITVL